MQWGQCVQKLITFSTHWATLPIYSHVNNTKYYSYRTFSNPLYCTHCTLLQQESSGVMSAQTEVWWLYMHNMSSQHIPSNHVGWMGNNPIGFVFEQQHLWANHPLFLEYHFNLVLNGKTKSNGLHWCHCSHHDSLQTTKPWSTITSLVCFWGWPWID